MNKIPVIKADSNININIGTHFTQQLSSCLYLLTKDISSEEIQEFKDIIENNKPLTKEWHIIYTTIHSLLMEVFQKAQEQGLVEEKEITQGDS